MAKKKLKNIPRTRGKTHLAYITAAEEALLRARDKKRGAKKAKFSPEGIPVLDNGDRQEMEEEKEELEVEVEELKAEFERVTALGESVEEASLETLAALKAKCKELEDGRVAMIKALEA